jgi:hypothetical protein
MIVCACMTRNLLALMFSSFVRTNMVYVRRHGSDEYVRTCVHQCMCARMYVQEQGARSASQCMYERMYVCLNKTCVGTKRCMYARFFVGVNERTITEIAAMRCM